MAGLKRLDGILSGMKITQSLFEKTRSFGRSDLFEAVDKHFKSKHLQIYKKTRVSSVPLNGFDELIRLTEQGKLWRYPIDNEQGLEAEKQVPFEDHVFLDSQLKDFPKLQFIQSFMQTVISGLARNHWMTVKRKHDVIKFYKDYFEANKHLYENVETAKPPPEYQ